MQKFSDVFGYDDDGDDMLLSSFAMAALPEVMRELARRDVDGDSFLRNAFELGVGSLTGHTISDMSLTHGEYIAMQAYSVAAGMVAMHKYFQLTPAEVEHARLTVADQLAEQT